MTRHSRFSATSFRQLLATIAAATTTAMLTACGGGSADSDASTAVPAFALADTSSQANAASVRPVNAPEIADQGPIAPEAMDTDAQAELRAATEDAKAATAAETSKPVRSDATAVPTRATRGSTAARAAK
jgi:hypothetical protein